MRFLKSCFLALIFAALSGSWIVADATPKAASPRTRLLINDDWRFIKGDPPNSKTNLQYDAVKSWILPTGNNFFMDPAKRAKRPDGNPGDDVAYFAAGLRRQLPGGKSICPMIMRSKVPSPLRSAEARDDCLPPELCGTGRI